MPSRVPAFAEVRAARKPRSRNCRLAGRAPLAFPEEGRFNHLEQSQCGSTCREQPTEAVPARHVRGDRDACDLDVRDDRLG